MPTLTGQRDAEELRLEKRTRRRVRVWAKRAGFARYPHVLLFPEGHASVRRKWASSIADGRVLFVNPRLLTLDVSAQDYVFSHELGHLWHGHGRGDLWRNIGGWVLALGFLPVVWALTGSAWPGLVLAAAAIVWYMSACTKQTFGSAEAGSVKRI